MAKTFVLETASRNAACDAIVDLLDGGGGTNAHCVIYTAASALELVDIPLGAGDAFGAAAAGVCTMTATSPSATASAAGTAAKFQLQNSHATTPVKLMSGNVGTTATTMDISNTTIATSDIIKVTAMTVTVPAS